MRATFRTCGLVLALAGACFAKTVITFEATVPDGSDELAKAKKFAAAYKDGHPFAYKIKIGAGEAHFKVTSNREAQPLYEGPSVPDAEQAAVMAMTDLPVPGRLVEGVTIKYLKAIKKQVTFLGYDVESAAIRQQLDRALKNKKPGPADEAKAIMDAIAARKTSLARDIDEALAANTPDDQAEALRDMRWYVATWPSEKSRYLQKILDFEADPAIAAKANALKKLALKRK